MPRQSVALLRAISDVRMDSFRRALEDLTARSFRVVERVLARMSEPGSDD